MAFIHFLSAPVRSRIQRGRRKGSTTNSSITKSAGLTTHANEVGRCKSNGCHTGLLGDLATLGESLVRGHLEGGPSVDLATISHVGEIRLFPKWQRPRTRKVS